MGTERFPRQAEELPTKRFSASTRRGFLISCQMAASNGGKHRHIDFKTAFLHGQSYEVSAISSKSSAEN